MRCGRGESTGMRGLMRGNAKCKCYLGGGLCELRNSSSQHGPTSHGESKRRTFLGTKSDGGAFFLTCTEGGRVVGADVEAPGGGAPGGRPTPDGGARRGIACSPRGFAGFISTSPSASSVFGFFAPKAATGALSGRLRPAGEPATRCGGVGATSEGPGPPLRACDEPTEAS